MSAKALALALGLGAVGVAASLALQVDDWSRDLTQNHAATRPEHPDPELRSLRSPLSVEELSGVVFESVEELPGCFLTGWTQRGAERVIRLERTTALFRFVDDVTVRIQDRGATRLLEAEARSRVGKGDLGQNPRTLRALLSEVRARLETL